MEHPRNASNKNAEPAHYSSWTSDEPSARLVPNLVGVRAPPGSGLDFIVTDRAPEEYAADLARNGPSIQGEPVRASHVAEYTVGKDSRRIGHGETQHTRQKIAAALAEDARCRHPGVTDGIYRLADGLAPFTRLGHGVPVLRCVDRHGGAPIFERAENDQEFRSRFRALAPYLEDFDFEKHGVCLAGGAASGMLMHKPQLDPYGHHNGTAFHDYDLFLVGHKSDASALKAIEALGAHLYTRVQEGSQLEVYRTQNCITFYGKAPPRSKPVASWADISDDVDPLDSGRDFNGYLLVQVILRRYSTLGEVIHGFDMGSSAVLWDGHELYLTALGKLAAEHGANVLNLVARRSSYERRLSRYFKRGYDLVLPEVDACSLVAACGRLPYLYAAGLKSLGCSCTLTAESLTATRPGYNNNGQREGEDHETPEVPDSDYALGQISYGNARGVLSHNLRILGEAEVRVEGLCAHGPYVLGSHLPLLEPVPDVDMMAATVSWCFMGADGNVNLKTLKRFLGPDATLELVMAYMETGKAPSHTMIRQHCAERARKLTYADGVLRAHIPFAFMTVEDKTALTGPFPRAVVSKEEWYGECMVPRF